jgi:hypothetical protein
MLSRRKSSRPKLDRSRYDGFAIPKPIRVRDKAVLKSARDRRACEVCGKRGDVDPHHVFAKCDEIEALILSCCRLCHGKIHDGHISRDDVLAIIAARPKSPVKTFRPDPLARARELAEEYEMATTELDAENREDWSEYPPALRLEKIRLRQELNRRKSSALRELLEVLR